MLDQDLSEAFNVFDWQLDALIGVLAAFVAIFTLRLSAWLLPAKSYFTVSARRVTMPRDPPEVLGQKMADAIVDKIEDEVYRKELTPDAALFKYALLANVLGDKDYLPKGESLLRERLTKILNPPTSTSEAVSSILAPFQKKG